jgi:Recombination endonuclease VII
LHILMLDRYKAWVEGRGSHGLITRMRRLRQAANWNSKRLGYMPILLSPDEMLKQWDNQNGVCVACGKNDLSLFESNYDHDHETGEGRGFIHPACNKAEGYLKNFSDESFLHFMKWMRPRLFDKEPRDE